MLPDKPDWRKRSASSDQPPPEKYAKLTEAERWQYHTHVYAFRLVYPGMPETQHFWDGDQIPEEDRDVPGRPQRGRYFNADMIAKEVARLEAKKAKQDGSARRRSDPRNDPTVQAQRAAWIKHRRYPSWDAYLDAVEAGREKITAFLAWCQAQNPYPERVGTFNRVLPPAAE
jgi:hypothetical protein